MAVKFALLIELMDSLARSCIGALVGPPTGR